MLSNRASFGGFRRCLSQNVAHYSSRILHFQLPSCLLCTCMRATALFIMIVLIAPLAMQLSVMTWYQVNRGYISEVLCENREMPEMHCDGKCVLAQKLKQANQQEQQQGQSAMPEIQLIVSPFIFNGLAKIEKKHLSSDSLQWNQPEDHYSLTLVSGLFHPPTVG